MPVIFVNDDLDHPYLTAHVALVDRIRRAAKWCRQTDYQFVESAIEDKLDELAAWMEADELKEEDGN